jgi:curved DNA-binding protein CbpA
MAFKKLSLKYHPDRQTAEDDAVLADERFRAVNAAYDTLSNPTKRADYDAQRCSDSMSSDSDTMPAAATADPSAFSVSGIGRVFGAVINKLGLPITTHVAADIINTAHEICQ